MATVMLATATETHRPWYLVLVGTVVDLAIARFIGPQTDTTAVAALDPMPLPQRKPHMTQLVAASYPMRHFKPATDRAASELIAAYAPDTSVVSQDMFAALFAVPGSKPPVPAPLRNPGDHWWAVNPLPASVFDAKQQKCLAEAIYFEARSETHRGQVAVAQVVLNRVKNPAYPATICDVVYQNRNLYNECQFSFACDGIRDVVYSIPSLETSTEDRLGHHPRPRLARRDRHCDPLPRHLRAAELGQRLHEEGQDRPARFLSDGAWWLELMP